MRSIRELTRVGVSSLISVISRKAWGTNLKSRLFCSTLSKTAYISDTAIASSFCFFIFRKSSFINNISQFSKSIIFIKFIQQAFQFFKSSIAMLDCFLHLYKLICTNSLVFHCLHIEKDRFITANKISKVYFAKLLHL